MIRIPRWALVALSATLVSSLTIGLLLEGEPWADLHPYLVNLLSALTGFAASGLFAALVVSKVQRGRYWDVELNRRTWALTEIDVLLRDLAEAFGSSRLRHDAVAALRDAAQELSVADPELQEEASQALAHRLRTTERDLLSEVGYPDWREIGMRFQFIGDSRVEYMTDRLERKSRDLRARLKGLVDSGANHRLLDAYSGAVDVAAASVDLREWIYDAPNASMRRAVENRAYRSDLTD